MQDNFVIAYQSRKLKTNEKRYIVYDFELTVVIHALKMWMHYLLGKKLIVVTDHINLKYLFSELDLNVRQARWMAFLHEFEFEIKHIKGKENKRGYALSNMPVL